MVEEIVSFVIHVFQAVLVFFDNYYFLRIFMFGVVAPFLITVLISYSIWGYFRGDLFTIFFVPCMVAVLIWQYKISKR